MRQLYIFKYKKEIPAFTEILRLHRVLSYPFNDYLLNTKELSFHNYFKIFTDIKYI